MKKLKNYWAVFIPILVLLITGIYMLTKKSSKDNSTRITGSVEAEFVDVSSSFPGRLDTISVNANDQVSAGQIVAKLNADEIETFQSQLKDAVTVATSHQEIIERGVAPEVVQAARNIQKIAEQQMEMMEKTYKRFKDLYAEGVVSGQEYDLVHFRYQAAQKELETARLNAELLQKGSNQQMKDRADALVNQAEDAEKLGEQISDKTSIKAPVSGKIATLISHAGEMVNAGYPIMTIQKDNSIYFSFNIRQDQLNQVSEGMSVQIRVPGATPEFFQATVKELSTAMGYADFVPENQKGQIQLKTFKIKCTPENPNEIKGLYPGMTAELIIEK